MAATFSASAIVSNVPTRTATVYRFFVVFETCLGKPVEFLARVFRWFSAHVVKRRFSIRLSSLSWLMWSTHFPSGIGPECKAHTIRCVRKRPYPGTLVFRYLQVLEALSSAYGPIAPRARFFQIKCPASYANHSSSTFCGGRFFTGTGMEKASF